jgi:hypothetical protein
MDMIHFHAIQVPQSKFIPLKGMNLSSCTHNYYIGLAKKEGLTRLLRTLVDHGIYFVGSGLSMILPVQSHFDAGLIIYFE